MGNEAENDWQGNGRKQLQPLRPNIKKSRQVEMGVHYDVLQIQGLRGTHKIDQIKHLFYALHQEDTNMVRLCAVLNCTDADMAGIHRREQTTDKTCHPTRGTLSISYASEC